MTFFISLSLSWIHSLASLPFSNQMHFFVWLLVAHHFCQWKMKRRFSISFRSLAMLVFCVAPCLCSLALFAISSFSLQDEFICLMHDWYAFVFISQKVMGSFSIWVSVFFCVCLSVNVYFIVFHLFAPTLLIHLAHSSINALRLTFIWLQPMGFNEYRMISVCSVHTVLVGYANVFFCWFRILLDTRFFVPGKRQVTFDADARYVD